MKCSCKVELCEKFRQIIVTPLCMRTGLSKFFRLLNYDPILLVPKSSFCFVFILSASIDKIGFLDLNIIRYIVKWNSITFTYLHLNASV